MRFTKWILPFFIILASTVDASTMVPIRVGATESFVPLPRVEALENPLMSYGRSISVSVGSTRYTTAYYYRQIKNGGESVGDWTCLTSEQVKANGDAITIDGLNTGEYHIEVAACIGGSGCNVSQYQSGALNCSEVKKSDSTHLADTGVPTDGTSSLEVSEIVGGTEAEFRVSETGAATYTVPIKIPAGSGGVQPQVALTYNSAGGSGVMGIGWNISGASAITRCPKTYVHDGEIGGISYTNSDRLCLDGQRLITDGNVNDKGVSDADYWNAESYHTEQDSFSRIKRYFMDTHTRAFTVETKSGEVHYYGQMVRSNWTIPRGTSVAGQSIETEFKDATGNTDKGLDSYVQIDRNVRTAPARIWALKAIKDVKGNYILYKYSENVASGEHHLTEIQYTGNVDQNLLPYAKITFNYGNNQYRRKPLFKWVSNQPISITKLLRSVTVTIDGEEYRKYSLSYQESELAEQQDTLETITECVGETCLQPLVFDWQKRPDLVSNSEPFIPFGQSSNTAANMANPTTSRIVDISGDGKADIVFVDGNDWKVALGPEYNDVQTLHYGDTDSAEYAKLGDFNGDGLIDLLVANNESDYWTIVSYKPVFTRITPTCGPVEECGDTETISRSLTTSVIAEDMKDGTQIVDINGDTLADILTSEGRTVGYRKGRGNGQFDNYETLITLDDESESQYLYRTPGFTVASMKNISALDVNGDGKTDLFFRVGLRDGSHEWRLYTSASGMTFNAHQVVSFAKDLDFYPVDLNADGLTDLVHRIPDGWAYRLSNGVQLMRRQILTTNAGVMPVTDADDKAHVRFADLNADGMTDILLPAKSESNWRVYLINLKSNERDKVFLTFRDEISFAKDKTNVIADANGDGKPDLFTGYGTYWKVARALYSDSPENVIREFTNSFGVSTKLQYEYINQPEVYYQTGSDDWLVPSEEVQSENTWLDIASRMEDQEPGTLDKDYFSPQGGYPVVSYAETQTNEDVGATNAIRYMYGGLLLHKNGRGMLGYERLKTYDVSTCSTEEQQRVVIGGKDDGIFEFSFPVTVVDWSSCVTTETVYKQRFPFTGMPLTTRQTFGEGDDAIVLKESSNELDVEQTASGGIFTYIESSAETSYALNYDFTGSAAVSSVNSSFEYDTFGNQTGSTITERMPSDPERDYRVTTVANLYGDTEQYQKLGRLTNTTVTKLLYRNGNEIIAGPEVPATKSSEFTYYADSLMLESEIILKDTIYEKTTTHTYDNFGNKESVSSTASASLINSDGQTRTSTQHFDDRGRLLSSKSNSLNHTVSYEYRGMNDQELGVIDQVISSGPNGVTTSQYLDAFGTTYRTTVTGSGATDPTLNSYSYQAYCTTSNVDCPAYAVNAYFVQASAVPGKPESQVFYDRWGREVAARKQSFDGGWSKVTKSYGLNGELLKQSEPFTGNTPEYFTEYSYDLFRRPTGQTSPQGNVTVVYSVSATHGSIVTTTAPTGTKTRETTNYLGMVDKIETRDTANSVTTKLHHYYSADDQLLKVLIFDGNGGRRQQVVNTYNALGAKSFTNDSDKGEWHYYYNGFGELVQQINSDEQITIFEKDELGRTTSREDDAGYTLWTYDDGDFAEGKLSRVDYFEGASSAEGTPTQSEVTYYKSQGLVERQEVHYDSEEYAIEYGYDELNRPFLTRYPANGFTVKQEFNSYGYPVRTKNASAKHRDYDMVYQEVTAMDARGNTTAIQYGNGTQETIHYEADTGWLDQQSLTKGSSQLHLLDYSYYAGGNLHTRGNSYGPGYASNNFTEEFEYDNQNRLNKVSKSLGGAGDITEDYDYDYLGNFLHKENVGYYQYIQGTNKIDSVWSGGSISNGSATYSGSKLYSFNYDSRGNVTSDGTRELEYAAFDKPVKVTKGSTETLFYYDANRNLYRKITQTGDEYSQVLYIKGLYEKHKLNSGVTEHKYFVGNAVVTDRSNDTHDTHYLHKDNLGSTITVTNYSGGAVQHFTYDAWGKQYSVHTSGLFELYSSPGESKGYTGHKMVSEVGIIHMNGRIYDPTLGRFLQADPIIQAPSDSQSYNRYAYVRNNPLTLTDPSGYSWWSKTWKKIKPFVGIIVAAVGTYICGPQCGQAGYALIGAASGAAGAAANGGNVFTGALRGAFTAMAFYQVGEAFSQANCQSCFSGGELTTAATVGKIAAHAMVGGITSVVQGGKFGHGFLAAGVTQGFAKSINGISSARFSLGRIMAAAVVGGTVSKLTGGKFANGATTGAFSRMFNDEANHQVSKSFHSKSPKISFLERAKSRWSSDYLDTFKKKYPYEYSLFEEFASEIETVNWSSIDDWDQAVIKEFQGFALDKAANYYKSYMNSDYVVNNSLSATGIPWLALPFEMMSVPSTMNSLLLQEEATNLFINKGPQYLVD